MFCSDGSMHHIQVKSKLLRHLEAKKPHEDPDKQEEIAADTNVDMTVAVRDGMAELNSLKLNNDTKSVSDLADQSCSLANYSESTATTLKFMLCLTRILKIL